jgi:hypothetical protein
MTSNERSLFPTDPITWWRTCHARDLELFARSHGRQPESLAELSKWLKPAPIRSPGSRA